VFDVLEKAYYKDNFLQFQAVDVRIQGLIEANKVEDRAIKQLEKQLKLNKRKRKSLPLSFKNDGLDCILCILPSMQLIYIYISFMCL